MLLKSLDEGRRQALQNNLRKAEIKRQQQIFQEINQQPGIHIHLGTNTVRTPPCDKYFNNDILIGI